MRRPTIAAIAATAGAAIVMMSVAACSPDSPNGTAAAPSTPPAPQLAVAPGFEPAAATAHLLPTDVKAAAVSPDSTHLAYAAVQGGSVTVGIVALNGRTADDDAKPITATVPLVISPDSNSTPPQLRWTGTNVALFQRGAIVATGTSASPGASTDPGASGYRVTVLAGSNLARVKQVDQPEPYGVASKVSSSIGMVITATDNSGDSRDTDARPDSVVVRDSGELAAATQQKELRCGGQSCAVRADIAAALPGGADVATFQQPPTIKKGAATYTQCSPTGTDSGGNAIPTCLEGFSAGKWDSASISAPAGAKNDQAYLLGADASAVVGAWVTGEQKAVAAVHDIATGAVKATAPDCAYSPANDPVQVVSSPSGRYIAAGNAVFDTKTKSGHCIAADWVATAVTDAGHAYLVSRTVQSGQIAPAGQAAEFDLGGTAVSTTTADAYLPVRLDSDGSGVFVAVDAVPPQVAIHHAR